MSGVLVVAPNLCLDRTIRLAELRPGFVQRPRGAVQTAGGKPVNTVRALHALGRDGALVALLPDGDGGRFTALLAAERVLPDADLVTVPVAGTMRVATILIEDSGRVTVLNEPGPQTSAADADRLLAAVARRAPGHRVVAGLGSLPPGLPADVFGRLTRTARAAGCRVVVDASRDALAAALPAGPDLVTPNLAEAEQVLGGAGDEAVDAGPDAAPRAADAVRALCARGAQAAAVTAGAAGVAAGDARQVRWWPAPAVRVANPIGAGDSFVAGLAAAWDAGHPLHRAVPAGIAAAAASCEHPTAGVLDPARAAELLAAV